MILSVDKLTHSYGTRVLFKDVSFNVEDGDKIGIIGVNGTGKSTLLRDIALGEATEGGKISKNGPCIIEYLPQEPAYDADASVLEQIFRGDSPQLQVVRQYEMLLAAVAEHPEDEPLQRQLLAVQQQMDAAFAWQLESEAKAALDKLGITDLRQPMRELSGGQRKRVALAGVLVRPSDLLILDEPTNHMDNETVAWLEQVLISRKGALLMVTHDRYFFDRVVNRTLELDGGVGYLYSGNYSLFLQKREERRISEASAAQRLRNVYRRELAWISRGAEARRTKSKERVERFKDLETAVNSLHTEKGLEMSSVGARLGKTVIECEHIALSYNNVCYIKDFNYVLLRDDRVGIVGPNGSGKTSLMDIITGRLAPTQGQVTIGQTVKIGYFAQHNEFADSERRVLEYIRDVSDFIETRDGQRISAAQMLERFLFPPELQWVPVSKLSGGEKRRLYLLSVLMSAPNVLILDEPTNDLDIPTLSVLEGYLDEFAGAVIAVSHDRYFLDRFAHKLFAFTGEGEVLQLLGDYSCYEQVRAEVAEKKAKPEVKKSARVQERAESTKMTYRERQEYAGIDEAVAGAEAELKMLEREINACGNDFEQLARLAEQREQAAARLDELTERWAYLTEKAEAEGIAVLWPILVTQTAIMGMNFSDSAMSGHAGAVDLAGTAIGGNLWMPVMVGTNGVLLGAMPILAQLLGAGKTEGIGQVVRHTLVLAAVFSVVIILWALLFLETVLSMMQLEPQVHYVAKMYTAALCAGALPFFFSTALRALIDTMGYTGVTMRIYLIALPINVFLNYCFIFGKFGMPALGGIGAGVATGITFWLDFFIFYWVVNNLPAFKKLQIFTCFKFDPAQIRECLHIGIPIGLAVFMESSIFGVIAFFIAKFGTIVIAAHQAAMSFTSLLYMVPLSFSLSLTILVGYEVGAGRLDEAKRIGFLGIGSNLTIALLLMTFVVFEREMVAALYSTDEVVNKQIVRFLFYAVFFQIFDGTAAPIQGILRAYKDVKATFWAGFAAYWLVALPLGWFLDNVGQQGAEAYWQSLDIGIFSAAAFLSMRMLYLQRKLSRQAAQKQ